MNNMKKITFLFAFLSCVTATNSFAAIQGAPYQPEIDSRFNNLESNGSGFAAGAIPAAALGAASVTEAKLSVPTLNGLNASRTAKAQYDFATLGGAVGSVSLGVTLPAGAIIKRDFIYTITQVAGASAPLIAINCETANNIFSAASMNAVVAGTLTEGVSTGAASVFKKITSACPIAVTISSGAATAGKFDVFVDYVVQP